MTVLGDDRDHLGKAEYEQLVERLTVEKLGVTNEDLLEVEKRIDEVPRSGKAVLRKFRVGDEDGVFEYVRETPNASVHNMLTFGGFLHDFLRSDAANDSIEGLNTRDGYSGFHWHEERDGDREFEWYHPLQVDGYLAWVVVRGGAYESFDGFQAEAKRLGRQFDREVFGDRYEDFSAWRIPNRQWSEWFLGTTHWDETLILADERKKELWLFMFTSTD